MITLKHTTNIRYYAWPNRLSLAVARLRIAEVRVCVTEAQVCVTEARVRV